MQSHLIFSVVLVLLDSMKLKALAFFKYARVSQMFKSSINGAQ